MNQQPPQEKAKELVEKYENLDVSPFSERGEYLGKDAAKQCALIVIDEAIKQCWDYRDIDLEASYDYWQKVKSEIEKL